VNKTHYEDSDPSSDDGIEGDSWINTSSGEVFEKSGGSWTSKVKFKVI
jgi:hypothetical protein